MLQSYNPLWEFELIFEELIVSVNVSTEISSFSKTNFNLSCIEWDEQICDSTACEDEDINVNYHTYMRQKHNHVMILTYSHGHLRLTSLVDLILSMPDPAQTTIKD